MVIGSGKFAGSVYRLLKNTMLQVGRNRNCITTKTKICVLVIPIDCMVLWVKTAQP